MDTFTAENVFNLIISLCFKIASWTSFVTKASNEVFALVLKNQAEKLTNKQLNDFKKLFSTNYPDVKFSLLKIKSLKLFKENLPKIIKGIDTDAVIAANNISELDLVAIACGPKYKSVS